MPLITAEISNQAFELIRDRIAEILLNELEAQVTNNYAPELETEVYIERRIPFDKTELDFSAVNVTFGGGELSSENIKDGSLSYRYYVDIFVNAKHTSTNSADKRSALRGQRMLGACRSILKNPVYRTLGFVAGDLVNGVSVRQIITNLEHSQDSANSYMARLVINIQAVEKTSYIGVRNIAGYTATLKLGDSDYGYKYSSD